MPTPPKITPHKLGELVRDAMWNWVGWDERTTTMTLDGELDLQKLSDAINKHIEGTDAAP